MESQVELRMSDPDRDSYGPPMQQTRVRPDAFRQATAVRSVGIGVTGLVSVLSGAAVLAFLMIISVAVEMTGGVGPYAADLAAALLLAGYVAVVPYWFARATRATTAAASAARLGAALVGYVGLWFVLLTLV